MKIYREFFLGNSPELTIQKFSVLLLYPTIEGYKLMEHAKTTLIWITDLLKKLYIPFQISGGLAAKAYGAKRELEDIDIDIPDNKFELLKNSVQNYIIFGPERLKCEKWDLLLMTLDYHGQLIDISGAFTTKIFNSKTNEWHQLHTDFNKVETQSIFGLNLPVIPRTELIAYKQILSRDVDISDVNELKN